MNLTGLSESTIGKMNTIIADLENTPQLGILYFSGIQAAHTTTETKRNLNKQCTHSFEMIFITAIHRDIYLEHPLHLLAVQSLVAMGLDIEKICVVDVDARLFVTEAQRYIATFLEKHNIGLKELLGSFNTQELTTTAIADIAKTTTNYIALLAHDDKEQTFWTSLQQSIFRDVTLCRTKLNKFI
jgi:hypothetical protein